MPEYADVAASIVITWRSIRVRSCYHLVEHQGTLLGMAPSPRVFLAAVIQRTQAGAAPRGLCSGWTSPAGWGRGGREGYLEGCWESGSTVSRCLIGGGEVPCVALRSWHGVAG